MLSKARARTAAFDSMRLFASEEPVALDALWASA
jgi:hypothetical protein